MDDSKRLHRNDPARTAPIREFSNTYRWAASGNGHADGLKTESGQETPRPTSADSPPVRGVESAYGVIERHISAGRRRAEQFNKQPYNTSTVTDSLQQLVERMLRYQTELIPLCVEVLGNALKFNRTGFPGAPDFGPPPSPNRGSNHGYSVALEIESTQPVQVSVDLRECRAEPPVVLGLRSVDPAQLALTDINFVPAQSDDRLKLRMRIPDGHPCGTYSGVLVERASGAICGTLSVRVGK